MKHLRQLFLATLLIALFVRPGLGCSHEGSSAVFTQRFRPDQPYSAFTQGRLGVIGRTYSLRHLVVAYDTLSGRGLTPAEQKAAEDVDRYDNPEGYGDTPTVDDPTQKPGIGSWLAATGRDFGVEHSVPGQDYNTFTNCLDDAFAHAAATVTDLRSRYGNSPAIQDWITAQQIVFANCSDGSSVSVIPPRQRTPQQAYIPDPAPANAPLWLRQQRAYQIAAAQFYSLDYDSALSSFRAIAADQASPLAPLARYLVARVFIRKAELTNRSVPPGLAQEAARKAQEDIEKTTLANYTAARDQLEEILRNTAMQSIHPQSRHLLDLVMLRVDPQMQAQELARRLTAPTKAASDADYKHNVIDLGFAYDSLPQVAWPQVVNRDQGKTVTVKPQNPLLRWIDDMHGANDGTADSIGLNFAYQRSRSDSDRLQDALESWRTTHGLQWLVAALTLTHPTDDSAAELIAAAEAVPSTSPAYADVTWQRLRLTRSLTQPGPSTYTEVSTLLPQIERTQSRSTINLYLDVQSASAPTLDAFLKSSPRLPASYTDEDGYEDGSTTPDYPIDNPGVELCGVYVYAPQTSHFDGSVATILNQRMSLRLLREAALSPTLPPNLRFQLAHMAWTRALLLNDAETSLALAPYLAKCQPAFKTWLDQYAAAKTSDERHVLGLLAMMRFTSTEPVVRVGGERDFAVYDGFRDNWWCTADTSGQTYPPQPKPTLLFSQPIVPATAQPDPPFFTQDDRAAVDREIAALEKFPPASDYFAQQALDWVMSHPDDPRNADVLGFAMRVVRNACRTDATAGLNHQLFSTLHDRFPNSEWAKRYTTWE
jgi:hypothetical protein